MKENVIEGLINQLGTRVTHDREWKSYINKVQKTNGITLHLAIFIEPFLSFVLDGTKTIESRFSINKTAPYKRVHRGDVLLIKKSGGPIIAVCKVSEIWNYELDPKSWKEIKGYAAALRILDSQFWSEKKKAKYATLMKISDVKKIEPIEIQKADRRGWVTLNIAKELTLFENGK